MRPHNVLDDMRALERASGRLSEAVNMEAPSLIGANESARGVVSKEYMVR